MSAVHVINVHKHFGGIVVAEDINLELNAGEILGLIGPNGAGKTTLFNLISGIHAPDRGEIWLGGQALSRLPVYRRARLGIARTWQHVRLFPTLSVIDNLLMGPRDYPGEALFSGIFNAGARRRQAEATRGDAQAILARIGLTAAADKLPGELPFGQQKLVGLARTLMNDGKVLLLDEPMAGVEGQSLRNHAAGGARRGCRRPRGLAWSSTTSSFIRDLCTRAVFMFNGCIEQSGTVEELLASDKLAELYFGGKK